MKVYLIRHGRTKGNCEGRYVGRTDEPLLSQERERLCKESCFAKRIGPLSRLYVSPMLRCRETAEILFPGREQILVKEFRECDFGDFEYKNYKELSGNPDYQRFIDSGGAWGFPGGESVEGFRDRCARAFYRVAALHQKQGQDRDMILMVHGGTIMAILDRFSSPHGDYFAWQTGNGNGYAAELSWDRENGKIALENISGIRCGGG